LLQKLELVRSVSQSRLAKPPIAMSDAPPPIARPRRQPRVVVAIGSSTGGPTALTDVLSRLPQTSDYAVLVAQHMPAKFTRTFAQRLNRYSSFSVAEAVHGEPLQVGQVIVCPGNSCMEVVREDSSEVRIKLSPPNPDERYIPNATRLFTSVAALYGRNAVGVVLTGMGDDGALGAQLIAAAGGQVLVESEETAVVYGMPRATRHLVPDCYSAPLNRIADQIQYLVGSILPTSRP
jgi:two-component system, chemotaxis family, protein-glutamate methylesterase/glutaminase